MTQSIPGSILPQHYSFSYLNYCVTSHQSVIHFPQLLCHLSLKCHSVSSTTVSPLTKVSFSFLNFNHLSLKCHLSPAVFPFSQCSVSQWWMPWMSDYQPSPNRAFRSQSPLLTTEPSPDYRALSWPQTPMCSRRRIQTTAWMFEVVMHGSHPYHNHPLCSFQSRDCEPDYLHMEHSSTTHTQNTLTLFTHGTL